MGFTSYLKAFVASINGFYKSSNAKIVSSYIDTVKSANPNIKIYGDLFPSIGLNVVVILSESITESLQRSLNPNDSIVTIVITGSTATSLQSVTDVQSFVLDLILDKLTPFGKTAYQELKKQVDDITKANVWLQKIVTMAEERFEKTDINILLKQYVKSQLTNKTIDLTRYSGIKDKILNFRKELTDSEYQLIIEMLTNVFSKQMNFLVEQQLSKLKGNVSVY